MQFTSIQQVLDQLDAIILETEAKGSRQGYFAVLYRRMTLAVQEGCTSKVFGNEAAMVRLDTNFASRYINAYQAYNTGQPLSAAWRIVFDACDLGSLTVIQ